MSRLLKRPTTTDCAKSGVALKNWPPPLSCFLAYEPASVTERSLRGWNSSLLWAAQRSCLKIFCGVCETLKKSAVCRGVPMYWASGKLLAVWGLAGAVLLMRSGEERVRKEVI